MGFVSFCRVSGLTLALCISGACWAQQASPLDDAQQKIVVEGEKPTKDRVVCRSERVTGSIMPKRVCRSERQAEADRERGLAYREALMALADEQRETRLIRDSQVADAPVK